MYSPVKKKPTKVNKGKIVHISVKDTIINNSPGKAENKGKPILATENMNQKNENTGNVSAKPETRMLSRYPNTEYR